ncbi:MAG TPA: M28 family peptidase [Clostridia bacterium]|nr:M28 family peptidase [Clostridia bacterium]
MAAKLIPRKLDKIFNTRICDSIAPLISADDNWQMLRRIALACSLVPVLLSLLVLGALTVPLAAQEGSAGKAASRGIRYRRLLPETIQERLAAAPRNNAVRGNLLRESFSAAGCSQTSEAVVKGEKLPNVICTLPGKSDGVIIIGAHFDHVVSGDGVVDNWSGAALLPSLFESVRVDEREHTLVFIGFTAEEKGLIGSKSYVKSLTREQRSNILAMVNIDTLGLSPTKVWGSHADPALVKALAHIASMMHLPVAIVNVENVGSADSEAFREKKIPAITIHSVTESTLPILHSDRDRLNAIRPDDYYQSYMLLAGYIVYLDQNLDRTPAPANVASAGATSTTPSERK